MSEEPLIKTVKVPVAKLELIYEMATGALQINGNAESTDVFLNMLAQATRHMEARFRMEYAVSMQQRAAEELLVRNAAQHLKKGS